MVPKHFLHCINIRKLSPFLFSFFSYISAALRYSLKTDCKCGLLHFHLPPAHLTAYRVH